MNYYNDNDPRSVEWLNFLIKKGLIPDGLVDSRNISDVTVSDLKGFTQHHFFAGIGGWPKALEIARWPSTRPVWTASLPCQPFSLVGERKGVSDDRHMWPIFFELVRKYKPERIFGEQVTGAIKQGWLDVVQTDLEKENYFFGACVLGAHSVGAPHIRQRVFWVGYSNCSRLQGYKGYGSHEEWEAEDRSTPPTSFSDHWELSDWRQFKDGRTRPIQPGTFPLANGVPNRVGLLYGYGNAIVPQVGAAFIQATEKVHHHD